jgi:regulatory protein
VSTRSPGARRLGRGGPAKDRDTEAQSSDPVAHARGICLKLLTARPRSRAELAEALRRRGVTADVAEPVLDRLAEVGLVDDAAFAETTVHSGHAYRGLGRRALSAELRHKGVADEVAREAVAAVAPEDEEQRARELVRRRLRTTSPAGAEGTAGDDGKLARRLAAMLARKGYSAGLAWRVVRDELGPGNWVESEPGLD